jgi:4-amino-4-deoxy-L-arabinose transferase-like glycosyltransferase
MKKRKKKELPVKHQGSVPLLSFVDGNVHFLLPAILFGALLVRILAFSNFSHSLYGDFLLWDERVYQSWAEHILDGKPYVVHDFSPLPAYVMAAVYRLFSIDPDYVRMVNIILGIFTCLFIYCIGRDLANRTIGLIACLIAALYKPFIFFSITILKESLGLFLFSATIYLFISLMKDIDPPPVTLENQEVGQAINNRSWMQYAGKILFLGITAGLLINVRQNCIVLLPVFPFFLLWMIYKKAFSIPKTALTVTVFLLGLFLSLSPFLIRNYHATGEFRASPAGGFNLYLANNLKNPYPYYRPVSFATSVPSKQATQFIIEASRRVGKKLSPKEASSFWTREVIQIAREHPGPLAWKLWQKTLILFNQFEAEDNYDLGFTSQFVPFFRLPFFAFWFIFPLGMAWMILSIQKSEKTLGLSIVFLIYALTLIAFFSTMRIRVPLLVILIPYAAMGCDMFFKVLKKQLPMAAGYHYLIVIAILTVIEFLPVTGTGDMTAHYNTHAINLDSKGFKSEALKYWQESSAMKRPYSAYANLALAAKYYQRSDYNKGNSYLEQITDDSFAAAGKYDLLGDALGKQRKLDQAILAYEKSLQINSGQIQVRMKLIKLYEGRNLQKAQKEKAYLTYIQSFYKGPGGL